jgi:hypothetical protein
MNTLRRISFAAITMLAFAAPALAEEAMSTDAMATDATAPAMSAMAPMSDADFELCQQQAATLTFPEAMRAAMVACHGLHEGMDVMAAIDTLGMGDAMMGSDAMAGGTMAPTQ